MKIGILTFHYGYNYGAVLQCVGLYQTLAGLGHDVDIIDYHSIEQPVLPFWRGWGLRGRKPIPQIRKRLAELRYADIMRERFDRFAREYLTFSQRCSDLTVANTVADYDALVTGSDQVWNRSYKTVTSVYFLDLIPDYKGKKISYAACCGHQQSPASKDVRSALLKFDALSVRNQVTYDWVHEMTSLVPEVVCDPTLLMDYQGMDLPISLPFDRYILAYVLGEEIEGGHKNVFQEIRKIYGDLPVVWVCPVAHRPLSYCKWADYTVYTAGPAEWLWLIKNATFVYTDSFHGSIFSAKFKCPFFAYYAESSRADRLLDFSRRYGLEGAVAGGIKDAEQRGCFEFLPIYSHFSDVVKAHRAQSLSFLEKALG